MSQGVVTQQPLLLPDTQTARTLLDPSIEKTDKVSRSMNSSDFPKQREHSVGARQWDGRLGKVDHCQAGGFTAYASRKGYTLLDRRLSLPEE
jgi:SRSO17 transposase